MQWTYKYNIACRSHKHWSQNYKCKLDDVKVLVLNVIHRKTSHNVAHSLHYIYVNLRGCLERDLKILLRAARTMTVHTQLLYRKNWITVPAAPKE